MELLITSIIGIVIVAFLQHGFFASAFTFILKHIFT